MHELLEILIQVCLYIWVIIGIFLMLLLFTPYTQMLLISSGIFFFILVIATILGSELASGIIHSFTLAIIFGLHTFSHKLELLLNNLEKVKDD